MFNSEAKRKTIAALNAANEQYHVVAKKVTDDAQGLFVLRQSSTEVVVQVETYVNALANSPKEFDKSFAEFRAELQTFDEAIHSVEVLELKAAISSGAGAAVGVGAAVGTAALGPTAAMAIATTFGTASTGAAISGLAGAAATNAALAWLGGGALAAGGAGMSGGAAFLALAGPVGWTIGIGALVGGGATYFFKTRKVVTEAARMAVEIEQAKAKLKIVQGKIDRLLALTHQHADGLRSMLDHLSGSAPTDYAQFNVDQKALLAGVINHVRSLSSLLNETVA